MIVLASIDRSRPLRAALCATVLAVALTACGNRDSIQDVGAEQLYSDGRDAMLAGNYAGAAVAFQNLSIRYPFLPITRQAQLDLIYVYYRSGQPEAALDVAETFARENPTLPEVAYCLYMIGLINFDRSANMIERLFKVDVTERPPSESMVAYTSFRDLIRDYPDSRYVADSRQRMIYLRNRLAAYENHVARYYLDRGAYVAAANRAKFALETYPGAPELEEALALMVEAYTRLGMDDLAQDAERVRRENFGDLSANVNLDD